MPVRSTLLLWHPQSLSRSAVVRSGSHTAQRAEIFTHITSHRAAFIQIDKNGHQHTFYAHLITSNKFREAVFLTVVIKGEFPLFYDAPGISYFLLMLLSCCLILWRVIFLSIVFPTVHGVSFPSYINYRITIVLLWLRFMHTSYSWHISLHTHSKHHEVPS